MNGQTTSVRRRRILRAALGSLLGFAVVLGASELALRFLLFSPSAIAKKYGARLRKAEKFGDQQSDDAYWNLQDLFLDPAHRYRAPGPDPVCGWIGRLRPGTYEFPTPIDLRGRRPVLLYGDSYAACLTPPDQSFPAILERSDLGKDYCLVNYGVGGYGVDQIYLLMKQTIDQWKALDPIVVVSFLVDDDFSRDVLKFRCWPKPHLRIVDGELVPDGPITLDLDEYHRQNPVGITSYLWRLLVFRRNFLPHAWEVRLRKPYRHREEAIALGRKLLEEFHRELSSRGLRHFFLEFQGWDGLLPVSENRWGEELVDETAARLGVPIVRSRPYLLAAADGDRIRAQNDLFLPPDHGHYNALGNVAAFEAMRQGIEGRFDAIDTSRVDGLLRGADADKDEQRKDTMLLGCLARIRTRGPSGLGREGRVPYSPFSTDSQERYLILAPGEEGPTEVRLSVPERAARFRGKAIAVVRKGAGARPDPLVLTIRVDGRSVLREEVPFWPDGVELDLPFERAKQIELAVDRTGPTANGAWIHIAGARLEWTP